MANDTAMSRELLKIHSISNALKLFMNLKRAYVIKISQIQAYYIVYALKLLYIAYSFSQFTHSLKFEHYMSEKLWRMDTAKQIENFTKTQNNELKESLNVKHSKSDIKLFTLKRKSYIEEDVFTYFYRQIEQICKYKLSACMSMAEYVYFLFAFPVENWHFHKIQIVSKDKPYAQYLRDSYIKRFPICIQ